MNYVITTEGLTKRYAEVTAVDSLDLQVGEGEIFGLLGPNGAGKTTTILMLLGLTEPTSGKARVLGEDPTRNPLRIKRQTGYLPDNVGFYDHMTGRENLRYTAALNQIPPAEAEKRIDSLLHQVGLAAAADRKVGGYSRGMRQRLGLADVLVKNPRLVILDEPTTGLDPEGAHELLELIRELGETHGVTILLSSHHLQQVQRICHRVGIFVGGKLIADGPIDRLAEQIFGDEKVIELGCEPLDQQVEDAIRQVPGVLGMTRSREFLGIRCREDIRDALVEAVLATGAKLRHLSLRGYDLEDIYRRYFREGSGDGRNTRAGSN